MRFEGKRSRGGDDSGFTMTELIVAIFMLSLVMALISAAVISMVRDVRKQQAVSDNLDGLRKATDLMDQQVRYATAVGQPGVNSGSTAAYAEWQSTALPTATPVPSSIAPIVTCTQWRLNTATQLLQYRTWVLGTGGVATGIQQDWTTEATGVVAPSGGLASTFATTALAPGASASATPSAQAGVAGTAAGHAALTVSLGVVHGGTSSSTTQSTTTFAAQNTNGVATASAVCGANTLPTSITWRP